MATTTNRASRDIYLPRGSGWTTIPESRHRARPVKNSALPGKTPLFVGGTGIVVEKTRRRTWWRGSIPSPSQAETVFIHRDGLTRSADPVERAGLEASTLTTRSGRPSPQRGSGMLTSSRSNLGRGSMTSAKRMPPGGYDYFALLFDCHQLPGPAEPIHSGAHDPGRSAHFRPPVQQRGAGLSVGLHPQLHCCRPLTDRLGTRISMAFFVVWWSVSDMLTSLSRGAFSLGCFRFLLGIGEPGTHTAAPKAVTEWFPPKDRALIIGIYTAGATLGAAIAPPLIAFLAHYYNWRTVFLFTGSLGLLWLIPWLPIYRTPSEAVRAGGGRRAQHRQAGGRLLTRRRPGSSPWGG